GGRTPFAIAVEGGYSDIVGILLRRGGVHVDTRDHEGRTPFMFVSKDDNGRKICNLLIHHAFGSCGMPFYRAAMDGDRERMEGLLRVNTGARCTVRMCEGSLAFAAMGARWCTDSPDPDPDRVRGYRQVMKMLENRLTTFNREERVTFGSPVVANSPV
ncbi:MAG: ankyrin repeat domain-containing protein, partial [Simkaniaceae bacterium]|nr:ankyrin repeat domain-containing protein [Simkaniaceae bacterium]